MKELPNAFDAMSVWDQFVCWKAVPNKETGKVAKLPCNAKGQTINSQDSKNWMTAKEACDSGLNVGFVFTNDDPFFFIDIDGAHDGEDWSPVATELCTEFQEAAVEVSQSGTGLHIFGKYDGEAPLHSCKNIPEHLELYTSGRFVAMTGIDVSGDSGKLCDDELSRAISAYFPPSKTTEGGNSNWTTTHAEDSHPIEDDEELIAKACKSKSVFEHRAPFEAIWNADAKVLCDYYPDDGGNKGREFDASSADAALAQHLSFWTGGNCARIERLMRMSELVRDKWDNHNTYMERTILNATARTTSYYSKGKPVAIVEAGLNDGTPMLKDKNTFLRVEQQMTYFAGCVYVCDIDSVFTPRGGFLKKGQFNSMFGGYRFCTDHDNEHSTASAWSAFVESKVIAWPKADSSCFRPELPTGEIIEEGGQWLVNTYVRLDIKYTNDDATPFMTHLEKLLPNERDREILLAYMATCVQHKGFKIQWCPLIQGVEGNGKTLFTRCLTYALGKRYTSMPNASDLDNKFNGWILNKLLIGVEDIYVSEDRRAILERMKPMITGGDGIEIQCKGADQVTRDICANFMLNSNHKDAIKKTLNDRRYSIFYTAQQKAEDLKRDGMTGEYFQKLYGWLKAGGYAAVAGMLNTYDIPAQFDPTKLCQRAPVTSSTSEAINAGLGSIEQEVLESIEVGSIGFANGWVSSIALDELITSRRKDTMIPRNKRRELMNSLGYDYHPHLNKGRVNNGLAIHCGGKPRLYIANGHLAAQLTGNAKIAKRYEQDQLTADWELSTDATEVDAANS